MSSNFSKYVLGTSSADNVFHSQHLLPHGDGYITSFFHCRIILYSASDPERGIELGRATLRSEIQTIVYHCDAVWVGTESGDVTVFRRDVVTTAWDLNNPTTIK